jgi:hypothetical protein
MKTLQSIFNSVVMDGETIRVSALSQKEYESLRVMLVRKFIAYQKQCSSIGMETYDDKFLKCSYASTEQVGTFRLCNTTEHRRKMFSVENI